MRNWKRRSRSLRKVAIRRCGIGPEVDAIEVAGVVYCGKQDFMERVTDGETPDVFSIYTHTPGVGADCIADRKTLRDALRYARQLAHKRHLPVFCFTTERTQS